ncbi:MAG TPA: DUF4097 family beta strand repeat-containing protein [Candidatus Babeliales bacterium]|nr:DUF4097 family beta strand repeat-containing protein [Candidatus Babeliales bacterium]
MTRASVVGMLVAAEVAIVGLAIYAAGHGGASFSSGIHRAEFDAVSIAPVAAGPAPHVVIDDADSRVIVGVSNDELVHVRDLTQLRGAVYSDGPYPRLQVARTSEGVRIERPHVGRFSIDIFGFSVQRIEVDVPPHSGVEIARCAGAEVDGVLGGTSVNSVDGHVTLENVNGSVDARSDDGRIVLGNVAASSLVAQTHNGRIEASNLSVTGDSTVHTDDGPIALGLAPNSNLTIDAATNDGRISVDGDSFDGDGSAQRTIRVGSGNQRMKLTTADGSIRIFTNGESETHGL